jgi:transcriptional regulator with XRE-family HTH domain
LPNKSRIRNDEKLYSGMSSTLGGSLVAKRKEAGLTQSALAKATQIPRKWLGRWERNRAVPSEEELSKLSQFMEL